MRVTETVECRVFDSFRVQQVAGLFDVPITEKTRQSFSVEVPDVSEDWSMGAIVGPSGSGKSTIARKVFGENLYGGNAWPTDQAVVDCFGEASIRQITQVLTAVGFSSPPSWVKPYHVLSNGEKFRCDLAKALMSEVPLVAFDEFSSLVDRTVAKVGSAAVAKSIRSGRINKRFVAVTCHYDIVEWLEPDWVLDMATGTLARGRLCRRPEIRLEVFRCENAAWNLFAKHHYMSNALHPAAQCYMATWNDEPVAFIAMIANFGHKGFWRISRVVTLPDYQGLGLGTKLTEAVGDIYREQGKRVTILASHPAILRHCEKSPLWRLTGVFKNGKAGHTEKNRGQKRVASTGRSVASFEYLGARSAALAHVRCGCGSAGRD